MLVDKPLEWTSFDVVKKLKFALRLKKVGHAGTLDPLATGLLIICTGKKTKEIQHFQALPKEYTGTLVLGQTTPSYDLETEPGLAVDVSHLTQKAIEQAASHFTGRIEQTPPLYSAIKVDGRRAYHHARAGDKVALKSRPVEIHSFTITRIALPEVDFHVKCSKGTYIRSLVHDFGQHLGVGAYLAALRRTAIGPYRVEDARTIAELTSKTSKK